MFLHSTKFMKKKKHLSSARPAILVNLYLSQQVSSCKINIGSAMRKGSMWSILRHKRSNMFWLISARPTLKGWVLVVFETLYCTDSTKFTGSPPRLFLPPLRLYQPPGHPKRPVAKPRGFPFKTVVLCKISVLLCQSCGGLQTVVAESPTRRLPLRKDHFD